MFLKYFTIILALLPSISQARAPELVAPVELPDLESQVQVYIEKDGKLYKLVDQHQIDTIIQYSEVIEIDSTFLENDELVSFISESQEDAQR